MLGFASRNLEVFSEDANTSSQLGRCLSARCDVGKKMDGANLGTLQHTFLVCLFALANKLRETHKKQNAYV